MTALLFQSVNLNGEIRKTEIEQVAKTDKKQEIAENEQVAKTYTKQEVAEHEDSNSCWIIIHDKVFDVTKFLFEHPGGYDIILEHAGRDATLAFEDKGHSKDAAQLLQDYYIGDVKKKEVIS